MYPSNLSTICLSTICPSIHLAFSSCSTFLEFTATVGKELTYSLKLKFRSADFWPVLFRMPKVSEMPEICHWWHCRAAKCDAKSAPSVKMQRQFTPDVALLISPVSGNSMGRGKVASHYHACSTWVTPQQSYAILAPATPISIHTQGSLFFVFCQVM